MEWKKARTERQASCPSHTEWRVHALLCIAGILIPGLMHSSAIATLDPPPPSQQPHPNITIDRSAPADATPFRTAQLVQVYGQIPLHFEANRGQTDKQVAFRARGPGYHFFLSPSEAMMVLSPKSSNDRKLPPHQITNPAKKNLKNTQQPSAKVLRLHFPGGNPSPQIVGELQLPGAVNYLIGNDPQQWYTEIPTYARVRYQNLYPGIDLVFYGKGKHLEYDWIIAPGADPRVIRLAFSGAKAVRLDEQGHLVLEMEDGEIYQHAPQMYQNIKGVRHTLRGHYILLDDSVSKTRTSLTRTQTVAFAVASYDRTVPLIIDPVLAYSSYLGGSDEDLGLGIAVDANGNAYVTGETESVDLFTTPTFEFGGGSRDAFVVKLNPEGSAFVYSTYLGGGNNDTGGDIAVDTSGQAYVVGRTFSSDFPVTPDAFDITPGGRSDMFVVKLNAAGSALVYGTYLGGSDNEHDTTFGSTLDRNFGRLALDGAGNVYVTGTTQSTDFHTAPFPTPAIQKDYGGGSSDIFVTKINPTGTTVVYSTYLGGSGEDHGWGIAVTPSGVAAIIGGTNSENFPTANPLQAAYAGGDFDVIVAKINAAGSALVYATFLGGAAEDQGYDIAIDETESAYVTGETSSLDFPINNAIQPQKSVAIVGLKDAFVAKLNANGSALLYGTYLGGRGDDIAGGIALDGNKNAFIIGRTTSADFPLVDTLFPSSTGGTTFVRDTFVAKLNANGSSLIQSTYLSKKADDESLAFSDVSGDQFGHIAVDPIGNAYITGETPTPDLPIVNPFQATKNGRGELRDAFVAKIGNTCGPSASADLRVTLTDNLDPFNAQTAVTPLSYRFTVTNNGPQPASEVSGTAILDSALTVTSFTTSQGSCLETNGSLACQLGGISVGASATIDITVGNPTAASLTNTAHVTSTQCDPTASQAVETTTILNSSDSRTLTVTKFQGQGSAEGSVSSMNVPGINCGPTCLEQSAEYPTGTVVVLVASEAHSDIFFRGWTGDQDCRDGIVTMTADRQCIANFLGDANDVGFAGDFGIQVPIGESRVREFFKNFSHPNPSAPPITVTVSGSPAFIPEPPNTFSLQPGKILGDNTAPDNTVRIRFTPDPNLVGSTPLGRVENAHLFNQTITFAFSGNTDTATLEFTGVGIVDTRPLLTVKLAGSGKGTVRQTVPNPTNNPPDEVGLDCPAGTCGKHYGPGTAVTLAAIPDSTSLFSGWSDPNCPGTGPCTLVMQNGQDVTVMATFTTEQVLVPAHRDFDGNGMSDILWRDTRTGAVEAWLMNGTTIASSGFPGTISLDWQIVGAGDTNKDGKSDIIWRNTLSGLVAVWLMNGTTMTSVGFPGRPSTNWEIKVVGDISGDGRADLIWRNRTDGSTAIWLMNGTAIAASSFPGGVPLTWQITGVGDVNGDGKGDVIWRNGTNGTVAVWLMNGLTIASVGFPGSAPNVWEIVGLGDMNNNSRAELVWRNSGTGQVVLWFMNGTTRTSFGVVGRIQVDQPDWQVRQVGDVNGDRKADLIWHNQRTGLVDVWLMDGATIAATGSPGTTTTALEIQ